MVIDTAFWMALAILIPLLTAIITFSLPRYAVHTGLGGSLVTTVSVIALVVSLGTSDATRHPMGGWTAPLGIDLVVDGLSALMLLITALIGIATTVYSISYFADSKPHKRNFFWPLWMFMWASLNALFLSGDVFNLYITLELLGLSAAALTALVGKPDALKAATRYLFVSLSGSLFYLLGVVFLYAGFGSLDIEQIGLVATDNAIMLGTAALISTGLIMKTALFPLHFWLPPAHSSAAAPVSALLSALVVKGSFYILLRLWLDVFYPLGDTPVPYLMSALGVGAILWGSVQAIRQSRLKLLIAYSTVAQIGYLFVVLPIMLSQDEVSQNALGGIVCFVLAHASAKAAAFLSSGSLIHARGDDNLSSLRGMGGTLPLTVATLGLAGISLVALPPSGGFIAKWLMLNSAIAVDNWLLIVSIIGGGLLAALYVMRMVAPAFRQAEDGEWDSAHPVPPLMQWSAFSLSVLAILLGFFGLYLLEVLAVGITLPVGGAL